MEHRTLIRDAVHGDISFNDDEIAVISSPQFQRMRGIRQLGLAHLIYPCAQHSRFEHSLGVAHMAGVIIDAVRSNHGDGVISDEERRFTRALALVHDIGHVPFGHTLEDERPVFPKEHHHDDTLRLNLLLQGTQLGEALDALGRKIGEKNIVDRIVTVMKYTHEEKEAARKKNPRELLFADIVGNTICADLLDYLARDTYFTGLQHRYDNRILTAFRVKGDQIYLDLDDRGRLRHSVFSEIVGLLRLRYTLGERIYYHPIKNVASAMISKAVELSGLTHEAVVPLRDDELLYVLENATDMPKLGKQEIQNAKAVSDIVRMLRARRFYLPAYSITGDGAKYFVEKLVGAYHEADNIAKRQQTEQELSQALGIEASAIAIFCPHKKMASKAAMVRVKWPRDPDLEPLQELSEKEYGIDGYTARLEIDQLARKHKALWRMTVFVDPTLQARLPEIKSRCRDMFYGIPDSDSDEVREVAGAAHKRVLEAIAGDLDPASFDVKACLELCTNGSVNLNLPADELRTTLPRSMSTPERPRMVSQSIGGKGRQRGSKDREQRLIQIAPENRLAAFIKGMPPVQAKLVEPHVDEMLMQIRSLDAEAQEELWKHLEKEFAFARRLEHNQFTADGFVRLVNAGVAKFQGKNG